MITDAASFGTLPVAIQNLIETEAPESVAVRYLLFRAHMTMLDNCYFQYESGYVTRDTWLAFRRRFRDNLSDDVFAAMYREQSSHYRSSFQELASRIFTELEAEDKLEPS